MKVACTRSNWRRCVLQGFQIFKSSEHRRLLKPLSCPLLATHFKRYHVLSCGSYSSYAYLHWKQLLINSFELDIVCWVTRREKENCVQVLTIFVSFLGPLYKFLPTAMVQLCISKLHVHFTSILPQKWTHTIIIVQNFEDMMRQWRVLHSSSIPSLCLKYSIASSPRTDPLVHQFWAECSSFRADSSNLQRDPYHLCRGSNLLHLPSLGCMFVTFPCGRGALIILLKCRDVVHLWWWLELKSNQTDGKMWRNAFSDVIFLTHAYISPLPSAIIFKRPSNEELSSYFLQTLWLRSFAYTISVVQGVFLGQHKGLHHHSHPFLECKRH